MNPLNLLSGSFLWQRCWQFIPITSWKHRKCSTRCSKFLPLSKPKSPRVRVPRWRATRKLQFLWCSDSSHRCVRLPWKLPGSLSRRNNRASHLWRLQRPFAIQLHCSWWRSAILSQLFCICSQWGIWISGGALWFLWATQSAPPSRGDTSRYLWPSQGSPNSGGSISKLWSSCSSRGGGSLAILWSPGGTPSFKLPKQSRRIDTTAPASPTSAPGLPPRESEASEAQGRVLPGQEEI